MASPEIRSMSAGKSIKGDLDAALEGAILELLKQRGAGKSICPSEAARKVAPEGWEPLMEHARAAAMRLVAAGAIVITQGGVVVDGSRAKGAIRLRKVSDFSRGEGSAERE